MSTHTAIHHGPEAAALAVKEAEAHSHERREAARNQRTWLHVAGRLLLSAVFLVSGIAKIANFEVTRAGMDAVGVASPGLFLAIAIAIEIVCGAFLFAGYRVRATAATLAVYLVALTVLIHGDLSIEVNRSFAIANIGIIAGLVGLLSHGAGRMSADVARAKHEARTFGI